MLEHVALHQTRFNTPGVAPDGRGVLLGKLGLVLVPSLDGLVTFFRLLADDTPLDDLLPTLKIHQVRNPLGGRELVTQFHAASSYLLDRAAQVARLAGGLVFTGSSKHFVKYRDDKSPLGYDVSELHAEEGADFVLYGGEFTQGYARVKELPFAQLVFRLSPRPLPGEGTLSGRRTRRPLSASERELLWLVVEPGLAPSLLTYLWRNRVPVEATLLSRGGGAFEEGRRFLLARTQKLPERMVSLFLQVPGIELYRPVGNNVVVELGYRHPFRLEACPSVFEADRFYVFAGRRDTVDVIAVPGGLRLVEGEKLIAAHFELSEAEPLRSEPAPPEPVTVRLRLVPTPAPPRRVTGTLLPWRHVDWLKRLVFAVPPTVLAGYRLAPVDRGLLIVSPQGVDGVPIGEMLQQAAPSIYVPVGYEFLPRVSAPVLTDHVGGTSGRVVVVTRDAEPVAVEDEAFEPLGRRILGRLEVELARRDERAGAPRPEVDVAVHNEPAGPLPLWGFRAGEAPEEA